MRLSGIYERAGRRELNPVLTVPDRMFHTQGVLHFARPGSARLYLRNAPVFQFRFPLRRIYAQDQCKLFREMALTSLSPAKRLQEESVARGILRDIPGPSK